MKHIIYNNSTILIWLFLAFAAISPLAQAESRHDTIVIPIKQALDTWKTRGPAFMSKWEAGKARMAAAKPHTLVSATGKPPLELINKAKGSLDIYTVETFGDCRIELELLVAKDANSGIYVMGQYELQVKDSHGKEWFLGAGDMGGIIDTAKPLENEAKKPGEWQHLVIEFKAPRFKNGQRTRPAEFVRVTLNGTVIQENIRMESGPTSGALRNGEFSTGPLMLQGGLGAVAYRNIQITPK